jgi:hypothetical protein
MRKGLTVIGMVIGSVVMGVAVIVDLVIQVRLFTGGNLGGAILYLLFGWPLTLTVGWWVAMLLAGPFLYAGTDPDDRL